MTHTIKLSEADFNYYDKKGGSHFFTQNDDIVIGDKVVFQFAREEVKKVVSELYMDTPGLKKGWTFLILTEPTV